LTAPAAITAQLVDVRNVSAHRCVRLELHVPAEQAGLVMAAFGWPTMADPVPVALARLQTTPEPIAKPEAPKERRPFSELPYSQQAALRCAEPGYEHFLWDTHGLGQGACPAEVVALVRHECGVSSRSEIIKGTPAGDKWEALEAEYYAWQRGGIR
jgi:hypothetical protein